MKTFIGFILGILVASAAAEDNSLPIFIETHLNAGVNPGGKSAPIRVDMDGYVICSEQKKP
jgi:hypothetical protein